MAHEKNTRKKGGVGKILLVLVVLLALAVGGALLFAHNEISGNGRPGTEVTVSIPQGSGVSVIAQKLKDAGVIRSAYLFRWYVGQKGAASKLQYGDFTLQKSACSYDAIIAVLSTYAKAETVRVTIPEGTTAIAIAQKMEAAGLCSAEDFLKEANEGDFSEYTFWQYVPDDADAPDRFMKCEGYLFPDTYQFYMGDDPENVIDRFLRNFDNKFTSDLYDALDALNDRLAQRMRENAFTETEIADAKLSLYDLITVASLVEKETARTSESATIASVIYNRLCSKLYPCLEIDATIQYALAERKEILSNADKGVLSPYNTYTNAGLPAGPIANPGMNSIRAALYPAETDYYFYALDTTGVHHFSETYYEHQNFLNELAGKEEEADQQAGTDDENAEQTGDAADTENQTDGQT